MSILNTTFTILMVISKFSAILNTTHNNRADPKSWKRKYQAMLSIKSGISELGMRSCP